MDQYSLKMFLELADSLHFGRTSRKCNVSPSVLSRTIQRLEEEVGDYLLFLGALVYVYQTFLKDPKDDDL